MDTMTVADLITALQDMPQDAEVRLATQPSWPLAFEVAGVVSPDALAGETECEEHKRHSCDECTENVVWIATGDHPREASPYAPQAAFDAVA